VSLPTGRRASVLRKVLQSLLVLIAVILVIVGAKKILRTKASAQAPAVQA